MRNLVIALSIASVVALTPAITAGASTSIIYGCGTVGPYTSCGNPAYVSNQLINFVMYLSAGIIQSDNPSQQVNSSNGYQTALNQLMANVYQPNSTQQTYLNLFPALAGMFRNAVNSSPYTYADEYTAWYDPTSTNPSTIWAALPPSIANTCMDYIFELAAA
jgi:hypothetical protein